LIKIPDGWLNEKNLHFFAITPKRLYYNTNENKF
jgi:hypothetical protein